MGTRPELMFRYATCQIVLEGGPVIHGKGIIRDDSNEGCGIFAA
jgi:hypothetical protein